MSSEGQRVGHKEKKKHRVGGREVAGREGVGDVWMKPGPLLREAEY